MTTQSVLSECVESVVRTSPTGIAGRLLECLSLRVILDSLGGSFEGPGVPFWQLI